MGLPDIRRSTGTRCQFPGCDGMAVYAGIRCPGHFGITTGEHDPGASYPPAITADLLPAGQPDSSALYCLCGLSLWATAKTARPNAWARHVAHMAAFREQAQRLIDRAIRERDEVRVYLDTDVWVSWLPGDWDPR